MMKRLIICLMALCVSFLSMSEVAYRKYDKYMDRDEFFDSSGARIGYSKYDKYMKRTVYYDNGGNIVVEGTPEEVAQCKESYTGRFLAEKLAL